MMNTNILSVVTPPPIYHGCFNRKIAWEENFTGEEMLFSAMHMKNCGRHTVSKHKDIKGSGNHVTLDISIKFDNLNKMKITSSVSKGKLEISGNGLIKSMGFKDKVSPQKYKNERHAIGNVIKKDLSKIIREFKKFEK